MGPVDSSLQRSYSLPTRGTEEMAHNGDGGTTSPYYKHMIRHSKSECDAYQPNPQHKLDKYGFILNMDSHGNICDPADINNQNHYRTNSIDRIPTLQEASRISNRCKKWDIMLSTWSPSAIQNSRNRKGRKYKLILRRARKGIPDLKRGEVWPVLCNVAQKIKDNPGLYAELVQRSVIQPLSAASTPTTVVVGGGGGGEIRDINNTNNDANTNYENQQQQFNHTRSFRSIQDTIERDIHRTYPRHALFYEEENKRDENGGIGDEDDINGRPLLAISESFEKSIIECKENEESSCEQRITTTTATTTTTTTTTTDNGLCGAATEITNMMQELTTSTIPEESSTISINNNVNNYQKIESSPASTTISTNTNATAFSYADKTDYVTPKVVLEGKGGQAAMRRVLKAYSTYDREIGYCQGMNFIAGMFLTLMSEEEAFWMLVVIMFEKPCKMRGLFAEGMRETHQVLYVAEKLISQFLPKLSSHLDKESIHVTMYATQWLLTQFTSSFRFDLVTRVWDCFLVEGWKITYRVMLSLLQHYHDNLLSMSFEEILGFFRGLPERAEGGIIVDEAMKISLRWSHIEKYEREWQEQNQQHS